MDEIVEDITEIYHKKLGSEVTIYVKEVDEITNDKYASKSPPIVVSHVKPRKSYKALEFKFYGRFGQHTEIKITAKY